MPLLLQCLLIHKSLPDVSIFPPFKRLFCTFMQLAFVGTFAFAYASAET
jgi:hypothetical protein